MLNDEICKLRDKLNKSIEEGKDYHIIYKISVELDELIASYYNKDNKKKSFFNKTIKIKKIRKVFKKKKIDYIICNYDEISNYLNTFVKDSIYINKGKLYFYGNIDVDLLKLKYGRYNVEINLIDKKIIEIDTSSAKNNFFKDNYYRLVDFKDRLVEIIGDVLMN